MRELAPGLHMITGFPPNAINCYLMGGVLVDAMTKRDAGRILKALRGQAVTAHALTHAHADHQGASHAVCEKLGIPFWVPERDADAAADPRLIVERQPGHPINKLFFRMFAGPGHPVGRTLREGDEVGGFQVLDTPGHSAGHVSFWRESDRVLVLGDVLNGQNPLLGFPRGLREPFGFFTPDPERNRQSIRRLGELEPALVCFGHGPPWRDTAKFVEFCRSV